MDDTDLDPTTLEPDELAPMLRAWAKGLYTTEAAVELLIAHDHWLRRRDFLGRCTWACTDGWLGGETVPMAGIDWDTVAAATSLSNQNGLAGSSSEVQVLQLAASLAGATMQDSLLGLLAGLDQANTRFVLQAIAHRQGWHEHGITADITGRFTPDDGAPVPR